MNSKEPTDAEVTRWPRPFVCVTATCGPGRACEELLEDE